MSPSLRDKVIVITGSSSGIGLGIAREVARQGAKVVIHGRRQSEVEQAIALVDGDNPGNVTGLCGDIGTEEAVDTLFAHAVEAFGRIDGLVANAGISGALFDLVDTTLEEWNRILTVNLTGVFLTCRRGAKVMIDQGQGGSIVVTGSSTAIRAHPMAASYIAAKSGVHGLVNVMALNLASHRIRVNTLIPGPTTTPAMLAMPAHMERASQGLPLGELVTTEELGHLAALLLSDALPHVTGAQFKADSGRTIA